MFFVNINFPGAGKVKWKNLRNSRGWGVFMNSPWNGNSRGGGYGYFLEPHNHSDRQIYIVEILYDFSMTQAARAIKIACDNRKQKSYGVNRP